MVVDQLLTIFQHYSERLPIDFWGKWKVILFDIEWDKLKVAILQNILDCGKYLRLESIKNIWRVGEKENYKFRSERISFLYLAA